MHTRAAHVDWRCHFCMTHPKRVYAFKFKCVLYIWPCNERYGIIYVHEQSILCAIISPVPQWKQMNNKKEYYQDYGM